MAAGTRIAQERISPAIATFTKGLYEKCADDGLVRGTPESKGDASRSDRLSMPHLWSTTHVIAPLWANDWPKRKKAVNSLLFVQFPLIEQSIRVGFRIPINPNRRSAWHEQVDAICKAITGSSVAREFAIMRYPDLGTIESRADSQSIHPEWLYDAIDGGEKFVSIQRSLPLDTLTQTSVIREMLLDGRAFIESDLRFILGESADA